MADMRTRNTEVPLPLLALGFFYDVFTSVGCKIIWQLCSDGLALGWMVITSEPLETAVLNFVQRRAISITTHSVYNLCVRDYKRGARKNKYTSN